MKKHVLITLVAMFILTISSPVFAEEPVPPAPGITKDEAQCLVQEIVKKGATQPINSINEKLFGNKKKGKGAKKGALKELEEAVNRKDNATANAINNLTREGGILSDVKDTLDNKILGGSGEFDKTRKYMKKIGDELYIHVSEAQSTAGTWGIVNLVAILLIGGAIIILLFYRTRRDEEIEEIPPRRTGRPGAPDTQEHPPGDERETR